MTLRFSCLLLACLLLLSAGCGAREEPPAPPPATPAQSVPAMEPEPEPAVPNPLTGLPMDPEWENRRPVAVMLNNLKAAQPQLGQSMADILYEIPAEGGITRMLAVYQSLEGVGNLGSIRSTRPYYLEVALGHDALLVHAGGSEAAYADIPAWGMDNMDGVRGGSDAEIFWRDPERRKAKGLEHSLLTSGEKILAYLGEGHFRTEHKEDWTEPLRFAEDGTPAGGEAAEQVTVRFSDYKTGVFDYSAETGTYLVSQYGKPYEDGNSGDQVAVTNLIVFSIPMKVLDSEGRLSVKLTGEGEGRYFCGGKTVPVHWSKANRNSPFVYTAEDGTPLVMGQGKTYVCIFNSRTGTMEYN